MINEAVILEYALPQRRRLHWAPLGPWWFWPSRRSIVLLTLGAIAFAWAWSRPPVWNVVQRISLGTHDPGPWDYSIGFLNHASAVVGNFDAKTVSVWEAKTGKVLRSFHLREPVTGRAWVTSSDEQRILLIGQSVCQLYDLQSGRLFASYPSLFWKVNDGKDAMITSAVFSPDGRRLLTYHADDKLRLWELREHRLELCSTQAMVPRVSSSGLYKGPTLAFSPDGSAVSCVTDTIWMGDGENLTTRILIKPVHAVGVDSKFSANSKTFFATYDGELGNYHWTYLDAYDASLGKRLSSYKTGIMGPSLWDETPSRLVYGIHFTGGGTVALNISATSNPSRTYHRYDCAPCFLFHGGRQVIMSYGSYFGGPVSTRVLDLTTNRQVASFPDGEDDWWSVIATDDNATIAVGDWNQIKLWRRVGPDDPWGLVGSPRFIVEVMLVLSLVISLGADARKQSTGFDAPLDRSNVVAGGLLVAMGTIGAVDAIGWALVGWWWWHVWARWLIDTLLLAALPCGFGLLLGSRVWRYLAILLCLGMGTVLVVEIQNLSWPSLGSGDFQTYDRDWPMNRAIVLGWIVGFSAAILLCLRMLIPVLFKPGKVGRARIYETEARAAS